MKTDFHLKLESMCRIQRGGGQHWLLVGAVTVRVPELNGAVASTRRAIYASYIGPVAAGHELVADCGCKACVKPEHQRPVNRGTKAKEISLPETRAALDVSGRYRPAESDSALPRGMKVRTVVLVKSLLENNTLEQVRVATGLSTAEVVKIGQGSYDKFVKGLATRKMVEKYAADPANIPDQSTQPVPPPRKPVEGEDAEFSEEEAAWLQTIK